LAIPIAASTAALLVIHTTAIISNMICLTERGVKVDVLEIVCYLFIDVRATVMGCKWLASIKGSFHYKVESNKERMSCAVYLQDEAAVIARHPRLQPWPL
jgi:hypothetical protein